MSTCTSTIREGNRLETCYKDAGHAGEHCNGAQPTYWWPGDSAPRTGGASGALRGARGDVPGSLPDDGLWPASNSVQGAVVRARLGRLRYALVDEMTALARLHRAHPEDALEGHLGTQEGCPVTDLDLVVLRQACTVLERVIQSK